jgi:hypothetical protein
MVRCSHQSPTYLTIRSVPIHDYNFKRDKMNGGAMKFKVLIVSVIFACSFLPKLGSAQNKVVVIPLVETVRDGMVDTENIMDNAVTGAKIRDGEVKAVDLSDGTALAEIKDDDGSGSGLDADKLDGHDTAYFARAATLTTLQNQVAALQTQVNQLVTLLASVTRNGNDITFSGVNVHIVNGTGTTDGVYNGRGNLIVGYNEERSSGNVRTGSHNIVVGMRQNYSSYGGLVSGNSNTISGILSSVSGGSGNTASGSYSSVSGGRHNKASGDYSFVGGGGHSNSIYGNEAFSNYSAILGGSFNIAGDDIVPDDHSNGELATISGGDSNRARGPWSHIGGGGGNHAAGSHASISGGGFNSASGIYSFVGGGGGDPGASTNIEGNHASGAYSAILGGRGNRTYYNNLTTDGEASTISGGDNRYVSGQYDSRMGSILEDF